MILSGGFTIHNLGDFACFAQTTARPQYKAFDQAILDAVTIEDVSCSRHSAADVLADQSLSSQPTSRKQAMFNLTNHPGFRMAPPREDHLVPLYIAAGAGEGGDVKVLSAIYGSPTFAFGV